MCIATCSQQLISRPSDMKTPVAIIFFNRIEPLKRLVARLTEIKPPKVYLISDGPRDNREGERGKVEECRALMQNLPWDCELKCDYSETNLGCRNRVTTGLDWVFEQDERAIILEDDCIPEPEFFPWVEKMLDRYADEPKVLSVGGTNLRPQLCNHDVDAVFSKYAMIWGWATWRRAWKKNDKNLLLFQDACNRHHFRKWLGKWRTEWYWRYLLTHVQSSWGYRWAFTHFANEAYCVLPPVNLVENIGMTGVEATHTSSNPYDLANVAKQWQMPNGKPDAVVSNLRLDKWIDDNFFSRSLMGRIKWLARKVMK